MEQHSDWLGLVRKDIWERFRKQQMVLNFKAVGEKNEELKYSKKEEEGNAHVWFTRSRA